MPKFMFTELVSKPRMIAARLGAGTRTANAANPLLDADVGKFLKLAGDSRYALCAAGDDIEGRLAGVENAPVDDYGFGTVQADPKDRYEVTFDGLQATPGTGTLVVGDIVVCGTVVARGTALTGPARVCKATTAANVVHKFRVVSLGNAGTGAVGTTGLIERV